MDKKIVGIVGSYRKGGAIDAAVEAVLAGARERGAATHIIYLREQHIEFCQNCRACTQEPGEARGLCPQHDDLEAILQEIDAADGVVLGSPVNYGNTTALFRRFLERLLGSAYWPWGQAAPKARTKAMPHKAVLVATSAMPGFLIPLTTGTMTALKMAANMLLARPVGRMCIGLIARTPDPELSARTLARARRLGERLAA
ncbi:MAG TPA: flavodoxin family protein [Terracidiphilus sp.]|nr:flavodoxin family protein [Terracidiphilus sp.]